MNAIKVTISFFLLLLTAVVHAQAPGWDWAQSNGSDQTNAASSVCTDPWGNVYTAGYFSGGTMTLGSSTLTNIDSGSNTAFWAKYDGAGHAIWAKRAQGYNSGIFNGNIYSEVTSICTDRQGNVYIAGDYEGSMIVFDHDTLFSPNALQLDFYLIKCDSAGNILWTQTSDISTGCTPTALATDAAGNVYITGFFNNSIRLGTIALYSNATCVFTAKYNSSGQAIWAKTAIVRGQQALVQGENIAADSAGNVCVTGIFQNDSVILGDNTLYNASPYGSMSTFTVKYDTAGTVLWASAPWSGNMTSNYGTGVGIDKQGDVYITGRFEQGSYIIFGGDTIRQTYTGTEDMYLVKYDPQGDVLWARTAEGPTGADISGIRLTLDNEGSVYALGSVRMSTYFVLSGDTIVLDPQNRTNKFFVAKYNSAGDLKWTRIAGNDPSMISMVLGPQAAGIAMDMSGAVYTCGEIPQGDYDFGSITISCPSGSHYFFLAKLDTSVISGLEPAIEDTLSISEYPNPTVGFFTINNASNSREVTIQVISMLGNKLKEFTLNSSKEQFDISDLASGIYQVVIKDDHQMMKVVKVVKE